MLLWSVRAMLRAMLVSATTAVLLPAVPNLLPAPVRSVLRSARWMRLR